MTNLDRLKAMVDNAIGRALDHPRSSAFGLLGALLQVGHAIQQNHGRDLTTIVLAVGTVLLGALSRD